MLPLENQSLLEKLIGQTIDQKYSIEKKLGQGGMGAVYLANHLGTSRSVALKIIAPQFMSNQELVERFRLEAKAAGQLKHPNVVNVTDFGFTTIDNKPLAYLVMEYLSGSSLSDFLEEKEKLPLTLVIDIVEPSCASAVSASLEPS
jgi:eukaryotic-like serine/threonine-protein kinase